MADTLRILEQEAETILFRLLHDWVVENVCRRCFRLPRAVQTFIR
jgi:hypothetical protein